MNRVNNLMKFTIISIENYLITIRNHARQVININYEEKRSQNWPLRYTRCNCQPIRSPSTYNHPLLSISQIIFTTPFEKLLPPTTPYWFNFRIRRAWLTKSKALEKSRNTTSTCPWLSKTLAQSSCTKTNWETVDLPLKKPWWESSKYWDTCVRLFKSWLTLIRD